MCLCENVKKQMLFVLIFLFCFVVLVTSEKILFPDEFNNYKEETSKQNQDKFAKLSSVEDEEIPIDLIQKLNDIQNASQLYEEFIIRDPSISSKGGIYAMASRLRTSPYTSDRSGEVEEEFKATAIGALGSGVDVIARSANVKMAPAAICKPELQTIPLYTPEDRRIFAFPSCTRVERCGGCCQHELLSCQPIKTETLSYQILLMQYIGSNKFNQIGKEIIPVEKHISCKCICKIKKEHCTPLQEYKENDCKCDCSNKDEEKKCSLEGENKLWDPHSCSCKCREITECSSGQFFSDSTCSCETIRAQIFRGSLKEDKFDYNLYKIIPPYDQQNRRHQINE